MSYLQHYIFEHTEIKGGDIEENKKTPIFDGSLKIISRRCENAIGSF